MKFLSYLISHFKKMYLIRKVLIAVGGSFLVYALYSLIAHGWEWPDHRGTWLIASASLFLIMSQLMSHFKDFKKVTVSESRETNT